MARVSVTHNHPVNLDNFDLFEDGLDVESVASLEEPYDIDTEEYSISDDMLDARKYLTKDQRCVIIEPSPQSAGNLTSSKTFKGDSIMATQPTASRAPRAPRAPLTAVPSAADRAKIEADKAKAKAAAEAEKAKVAAAKAKEKAAADKAKAEAKAKAEKDKAAAKAAADKAKAEAKAKADKAKAEAKAAREKAAKERAAARLAAGVTNRTVPADLSKYHKDTETKTKSGNVSVDIDDDVAKEFRGVDIEAVYAAAAKETGVKAAELKAKYSNLNLGMQRMTLGNRIRAARKAAATPAK